MKSLYHEGLTHLSRASSQVGMCPESEVWLNLVAAQVCFNASISDADAAPYYARAETLEWMGLLSHDREFFSLAIADLGQVIYLERAGTRPSLLLNALWLRSRLLETFDLNSAIADLTQASLLRPTELSFYLKRAECHFKRGCPEACTLDLMAALRQLLRHESPLNRDAYSQLHTTLSLELTLAAQVPEERLDRIASACATLRQFWSGHRHYWFYLHQSQN